MGVEMVDKGYLVLIIVGATILLVLVWLFIDFVLYYRRKQALRAAKIHLFYSNRRSERLALPHSVQKELDVLNKSAKSKRQNSFKRFLSFFKKRAPSESDINRIISSPDESFDSEMSDKISEPSSEKGTSLSSRGTIENETETSGPEDSFNQVTFQHAQESNPLAILTRASPTGFQNTLKQHNSSPSLWSITSSELNLRSIPIKGKRKNSVGPINIDNLAYRSKLPPLERVNTDKLIQMKDVNSFSIPVDKQLSNKMAETKN